jgi:PAS domain S-box-containing protein
VGANGQLIVNLIPELEFIIGKQPPVPDLPPQDARNRFQLVFRRFLGAFARPEHPLALFLDDLQWLDAATLELLEHLITDPNARYLMLVGAYRDNEVSASHPILRTLEAIRKAATRVQEIVLTPLEFDDVGALVSDALHCERLSANPLAKLVHEKTGGNPFFAIQFLTTLAEEGLLRFDPEAEVWIWDSARIRAKGYTDNVVDLMVGKLKRLSNPTQDALQRLACLGNVVEIATLSLVFGESEDEIHTSFLEAARTGLILRLDSSYAFLHDRIQEAAYALIPESERAGTHLRIGRVLLASMTADRHAEHLFNVANQLNQGAALLVDVKEKTDVAAINLSAGRKAKASTAYASARAYFAAGMALLDKQAWSDQHELTFSLWLERAECELLGGDFEKAEQLIGELLQRGASNVEFADASCLKMQLHVLKGEFPKAVDNALTCLRRFGIELPAHPTWEQVQAEYETVWQTLRGRPIESLIDLPLMSDPELQAAMQVCAVLIPPAVFSDFQSFCVLACRMVNLSVQHGMSGASANGCSVLGVILGPVFHRHGDGYRFAKLACDLVEKHGFIAYHATVYNSMAQVAFWTQPIASAIDFMRATSRAAIEMGDSTYLCYGMFQLVNGLLLRNDPLDAVWRESEMAISVAREAKFGDAEGVFRSQQRFIATMQGRTATFSTFGDAQFDEVTFEAQLTPDRMPMLICWYWILKLKARFLSGAYADALAAADKAKPFLVGSARLPNQVLDYFLYSALTVAALYEKASADEQTRWRELLTAHREQMREWAETYPPTFADKHLLVSAEIARLEGRAFDAMQLYDQAIQSAREHGFVQNEGLADEVAARFYAAHSFEAIAHMYLRNARNCYDRWGALGKVKQLDELYPHLSEERVPASISSTIGTPVRQLDVETVVRASQTLSSEIVLGELIEKLMCIAVEHAGAERGLLILFRGSEPRIEAEASTGQGKPTVSVRQRLITPLDLPQSALQYVFRTGERVVLDDASAANLHLEDEYVRQKRLRSVLCLPIVKQTKLIGALYLENNLTPRAFTADRIAVLELLASQAAISLENATLFSDLQRSEAYLAQGQSISRTGSFGRDVVSGEIYWSEETYNIFELDRSVKPTMELLFQRIHPDDREHVQQAIDRAINERTGFDFEYRLLRSDGSVKYLHVSARALETSSGDLEFVGAVTDVTERKLAEEALRRSEAYLAEAQRLAHTSSWALRISGRDAVHLSEEWYRIYGFNLDEGMPTWSALLQRIHPEDRAKWQGAIDRAIDEKSDYEVEFRLLFPDGTVKYLRTVGHPVFGTSGDLIEFIGSSTDVTERTRAAEALRQAQTDLAHANRVTTMGELAASLAHEVIQPLTSTVINAKTCMRWLQRDEPDLAQACEAVARIVKDGTLAGDIIRRIRSQFKKDALEREAVDVNEVIREMIALLRSEAMRYDISIRTELAADLSQIIGDRVQLKQVTMNLIVNSIDAMKEVDGRRELTIKSQRTENQQLLVSFSDTGIGLPPQQAEQIFNAFFTTKTHGTGMGLRISRSIIESHGGRLWAADNFPRGATFQFTLPVTAAAATA